MRLDLFLKKTCIVKSRGVAKSFCDAGQVTVNGRAAKSAQTLRTGDFVRVQQPGRDIELRVLEIPAGNVGRRTTGRYVAILRDDATVPDRGIFDAAEPRTE